MYVCAILYRFLMLLYLWAARCSEKHELTFLAKRQLLQDHCRTSGGRQCTDIRGRGRRKRSAGLMWTLKSDRYRSMRMVGLSLRFTFQQGCDDILDAFREHSGKFSGLGGRYGTAPAKQ